MNNFITLFGRNVKDIEVKTLPKSNTQVAEFTIAVQRNFKQDGEYKSDFINCSAFGENLINVLTKYVQKGDRISLGGRLQIDSWQKDGEWQNMTKVIVSDITLIETRRDRQEQGQVVEETKTNTKQVENTDDLPF